MTEKNQKTNEERFECAVCGDIVKEITECRELDGNIICVECIRKMNLYELIEITGIPDEDLLYDFLGLERPVYVNEEEEWYD